MNATQIIWKTTDKSAQYVYQTANATYFAEVEYDNRGRSMGIIVTAQSEGKTVQIARTRTFDMASHEVSKHIANH